MKSKRKMQRFCTNCGWVQMKDVCPRCGEMNLPEALFYESTTINEKAQGLELKNYQ